MNKKNKKTIYLADDHTILREGLKLILADKKRYDIIGESGDGKEALEEIKQLKPDIVLLDISMPTMSGIEIARYIRNYYPQIRIVILTRHDNEVYVEQLLKFGINGYVLKENAAQDLARAIEAAIQGYTYISPEITSQLVSDFPTNASKNLIGAPLDKGEHFARLTPREREILKLLAEGKSNKEISSLLWISPATVKTHRNRIMKKLDIHNIADLVIYAVKSGLIET